MSSRRSPRRGRRRFLLAATAVVAVGGLVGGVAFAYWQSTDSSNPAAAAADTLPAGAAPTAAATGTTVNLTFSTAAATSSGRPVATYTIRRYATGSGSLSNTFTCTPPSGSFTCTESSVPQGSWEYTDAASLTGSTWLGAESTKSAAVIVDTTPPTSTISYPVASAFYNAAGWNSACNVSPFNVTNSICGTATDPGTNPSGVNTMQVSIQSTSGATSGKYWGGSSFNQPTEQKLAAVFIGGNWTYAFLATNFPADGTYTVKSYATDNAGNLQTATTSTAFSIDNTAPLVPAPGLTAAVTSGTNPTFVNNEAVNLTDAATDTSGSGVNSVAYYYCSGATGSCTSSSGTLIGSSTTGSTYAVTWTTPMPADGPYRVVAVGTDVAGNVSASSPLTLVTVDTTPPTVSRPTVNGHS